MKCLSECEKLLWQELNGAICLNEEKELKKIKNKNAERIVSSHFLPYHINPEIHKCKVRKNVMKKPFIILLILAMLLALCALAFAEGKREITSNSFPF